VEVAAPSDLPGAFEAMKRGGSRAVLVLNHGMFFRERAKLAALAIENGIAVSMPYLPNGEAGALIAHEADFDQVWRLNAGYVAKILKGANPGDLPVQRLAAFRYAINLNTAKALGLTIPASILNRAALVIPEAASARSPTSPGLPATDSIPTPRASDDEQAIRRVLEEYREAILKNDVPAMDRIEAPEFTLTTPNGVFRNKQLQLSQAPRNQFESITWDDIQIRLYGDAAVVTFHVVRKSKGSDWERLRVLAVYVKQDRRWRNVAQQGTVTTQ